MGKYYRWVLAGSTGRWLPKVDQLRDMADFLGFSPPINSGDYTDRGNKISICATKMPRADVNVKLHK